MNRTATFQSLGYGVTTDGRITETPQAPNVIDLTPEAMKTPEGAAKVDAVFKAFQEARDLFTRQAALFLHSHAETLRYALRETEDTDYAADDLQDLLGAEAFMSQRQDAFLRALAGR